MCVSDLSVTSDGVHLFYHTYTCLLSFVFFCHLFYLTTIITPGLPPDNYTYDNADLPLATSGMLDFFYEPAQGLMSSPADFAKGLGKGNK